MDNLVNVSRIERHSRPTELDQLDKGTICIVRLEDGTTEIYEQKSSDTNHPIWSILL